MDPVDGRGWCITVRGAATYDVGASEEDDYFTRLESWDIDAVGSKLVVSVRPNDGIPRMLIMNRDIGSCNDPQGALASREVVATDLALSGDGSSVASVNPGNFQVYRWNWCTGLVTLVSTR